MLSGLASESRSFALRQLFCGARALISPRLAASRSSLAVYCLSLLNPVSLSGSLSADIWVDAATRVVSGGYLQFRLPGRGISYQPPTPRLALPCFHCIRECRSGVEAQFPY